MTWLKANGTTLVMAVVLSLLTVGMLTDKAEETPPVTLNASFIPLIKAEVGSLQYRVDGKLYTDTIPVQVSGDRAQIQVLRLSCTPILDESRFDADTTVRQTRITVTKEDFNLPPDVASRIQIRSVTIDVTYSRLIRRTLPIQVSPSDVEGRNPKFRIDAVTAEPSELTVKMPADKLNVIRELPIKPIRTGGRTPPRFTVQGELNTDLEDMKEVKAQQLFSVTVELSTIQHRAQREGIQVHLSTSPIEGLSAKIVDPRMVKVILEGPQDLVESVRSDQIHVFVRLDWTADHPAGEITLPLQCDMSNESLRKSIRVTLDPGGPLVALVQVTRG